MVVVELLPGILGQQGEHGPAAHVVAVEDHVLVGQAGAVAAVGRLTPMGVRPSVRAVCSCVTFTTLFVMPTEYSFCPVSGHQPQPLQLPPVLLTAGE